MSTWRSRWLGPPTTAAAMRKTARASTSAGVRIVVRTGAIFAITDFLRSTSHAVTMTTSPTAIGSAQSARVSTRSSGMTVMKSSMMTPPTAAVAIHRIAE